MPSESCPICGEEADADEDDPHGHFSIDDVPCTVCGVLPDEHLWGPKAEHEYESGI